MPAELGGESSLLSRPAWLPSKGSTPPAPRGRGQDKDAKLRKSCNCRNSRCLKLYCECFASGQYCFGCNCQACHNNPENDEMRKRAIIDTHRTSFYNIGGKRRDCRNACYSSA